MNLIKLINFEWNRLFKLLVILLIVVFAIQMVGTIYESNKYMDNIERAMYEAQMSEDEALGMYGTFSFLRITNSTWFYGPIFIGVASVLFYIFFIWYRDWFGKNTFIYRLLMLPTERVNIYIAKLVTILMMTFSFIAVQLIAILAEMKVMEWIVRDAFLRKTTIRETLIHNIDTGLIFPLRFTDLLLYYGMGMVFVAVIFTAIILERSFRLKGILLGILYAALAVALFIAPLILNETVFNHYFFGEELLVIMIMDGLLILAGSIALSGYLLKRKIRV